MPAIVSPRKTSSDSSRCRPVAAGVSPASIAFGPVVLWVDVAITWKLHGIKGRREVELQVAELEANIIRILILIYSPRYRIKRDPAGSGAGGDPAIRQCVNPERLAILCIVWGCVLTQIPRPLALEVCLGH